MKTFLRPFPIMALAIFAILSASLLALHSSVLAAAIPTGGTVNNSAPNAATPDDSSTLVSPTNVGSAVNFTVTTTDPNGEQYYLAICKTNTATAAVDAPPTCPGGSWGVSTSPANSGAQATASYTSLITDAENPTWYGFVCDKVAGTYTTGTALFTNSSPSVVGTSTNWSTNLVGSAIKNNTNGTWYAITAVTDATHLTLATTYSGSTTTSEAYTATNSSCNATTNTNSPFYVNHRPVIGTVYAGASYGSNASINPGATAYFQVGVTDSDSLQPDTISLYICSSNSFTPGVGCGGTTYCSATGVASGANAQCNNATLVPIPTPVGTPSFYVFLQDSHNFADGGTGGTYTYTVANVAPFINQNSDYTVSDITLTAGASVSPSFSVTVTDNNGGTSISAATAVLYDSAAISLSSGTCTANEKNCYPGVSCTPGAAVGITRPFTCVWSGGNGVWFNANASLGWKMHANPTDGVNSPLGLLDSNALQIFTLSGINILSVGESSIAYGNLALDQISADKSTTLQNQGNSILDIYVSGTDMTSGLNSIPAAKQKFSSVSDFTYGTAGFALQTSASGSGASTGCVNSELAVRAVHNVGTEDKLLHWKLQIPNPQASGSYAGSNTFAATPNTTCSGAY